MDIHVANSQEYLEMRELWHQTFGDDADYIDNFYEMLGATAYVVVDDDHVRAALTLFEAGTFEGKPVWVSYAICTEARYRGNSFASKLTEYVRDMILNRHGISLICPANSPLILFYENIDYSPYFFSELHVVNADEDISVKTTPLSLREYNSYREKFLANVPHISVNEKLLDFVRWDSSSLQSMLLINGGDAICTIESLDEETLNIVEIIVNPDLLAYSSEISYQIAQGLATSFGVQEACFRIPSNSKFIENVQGMVAGNISKINENLTMPYFGFPIE